MGMFSPETERIRQLLAEQMTHTTGQSAGGGVTQAKQRMGLVPPWYQTLSGERAGQGFTEALQMMADQRGDMQIGDTSINPIDFINPVAGIFGGKLAKTADLMALRDAMNRAAQGEDVRKVWQDTGWFQSPDGQWRFEIDDSGARGLEYNFTPQEAVEMAQMDALVSGEGLDRVKSMRDYSGMTLDQMKAEYARTGGEIVEAAQSGNTELAKKLVADRRGLQSILDAMASRRYGPMSVFMQHDELTNAYPDIANLHTRIAPDDLSGSKGQYLRASPGRGEQVVLEGKPTWSEPKSTMLHELQHAIQQREGFARGGSPENAPIVNQQALDAIRAQKRRLNIDPYAIDNKRAAGYRISDEEAAKYAEWEKLRDAEDEILGNRLDPYEAYKRLAGEAEARAVQSRMNLTPEQRRMRFPLDDYDVPVDELIMRFGN